MKRVALCLGCREKPFFAVPHKKFFRCPKSPPRFCETSSTYGTAHILAELSEVVHSGSDPGPKLVSQKIALRDFWPTGKNFLCGTRRYQGVPTTPLILGVVSLRLVHL